MPWAAGLEFIKFIILIISYSLGRKYTYKIEIHPRKIFNGMYVPQGAFSQSFRALAPKGQKLWLTADWSFSGPSGDSVSYAASLVSRNL